jgi:hypothetical protein
MACGSMATSVDLATHEAGDRTGKAHRAEKQKHLHCDCTPKKEGVMSRLRFDPIAYQFYFGSQPGQAIRAKAAGFKWDPLRSRYYTADPQVARSVADCADRYVKHLLADALGVTIMSGTKSGTPPVTTRH